jgi:hypothetical protein
MMPRHTPMKTSRNVRDIDSHTQGRNGCFDWVGKRRGNLSTNTITERDLACPARLQSFADVEQCSSGSTGLSPWVLAVIGFGSCRNFKSAALKRVPLEMNRDEKVLAVYPPHPEEGASTCALPRRKHRVVPVSKDGAAPMVRDAAHEVAESGKTKIAAPHHEAGRVRECIKFGICF